MTGSATPPEDLGAVAAQNSDVTPRPARPQLAAPLRVKTSDSSQNHQHSIDSVACGSEAHPAPAQPPALGPSSASPKAERLPSFRQLSKIADAAGEEISRPSAYPPPPPSVYPAPTAANQSPVLPHHPYPPATQLSPSQSYGYPVQTSPTSAQPDPFYPNSPPSATFSTSSTIYNPRRQSFPISAGPVPPPLNSMPTGSSSGESYTQTSSTGEGQTSTSQTTPVEPGGPVDAAGRPKYPAPPANMVSNVPPQLAPQIAPQLTASMSAPGPTSQGPWYCDYPGCTASPFPTQYLLKCVLSAESTVRHH
ncbi:hypothetical protein CAC42_1259 [Sphaceloma murrayae]|uniref:Uncharacterized protein n=1 Tax=Sphaceloma murrayae TaxID=2082308 RepID=A0A2K1R2H5_9PEZI|nr:hypothetical protein CAC42_1259 [Sphaceloma murrayae]